MKSFYRDGEFIVYTEHGAIAEIFKFDQLIRVYKESDDACNLIFGEESAQDSGYYVTVNISIERALDILKGGGNHFEHTGMPSSIM